uniref:ING domain-containing protein n=1 Tax=Rhabditophanes sp. KR3021 TaxID=114890 RepID=A0AC35TMC8_9BILA
MMSIGESEDWPSSDEDTGGSLSNPGVPAVQISYMAAFEYYIDTINDMVEKLSAYKHDTATSKFRCFKMSKRIV